MSFKSNAAVGLFALGLGLGGLSGGAAAADSPCQGSLDYLNNAYDSTPGMVAAFDATLKGLKDLPPGYTYGGSAANPWAKAKNGEALKDAVVDFYDQVCTLLPQIVGTNDNALDSIQYFAWLYYHNAAGRKLVDGTYQDQDGKKVTAVRDFLIKFNEEYKAHMDSAASTTYVSEWVAEPRLEIEDYVKTEASEYSSWNDFFARNLKRDDATGTYPSRPVTMPGRDYVIVSPTDCIMNPLVQVVRSEAGDVDRKLVDNPLQNDTVLDVKGIPLSVDDLLAGAPKHLKDKFPGGTGLACVLMPNTYHHFHSPVDGVIEHAEIIEAGTPEAFGTFGYSDWPNWVPMDGNVGRPGTDFSQFQGFTRGVIVIKVEYANLPGKKPEMLTGYVASIPVGLDTVGSVVFAEGVEKGAIAKKGITEFGNFFFGGSLNIMLFSPIEGFDGATMVSPAVQTRMGNQIGILNTPYPAPKTPWTPDS